MLGCNLIRLKRDSLVTDGNACGHSILTWNGIGLSIVDVLDNFGGNLVVGYFEYLFVVAAAFIDYVAIDIL